MPIYDSQVTPQVLRARGPCLPIDISLPQILIDQLTQQGRKIPSPVSGIAQVDTGASISVVDLSVISHLRINPIGVVSIGTAAGPARRNLYPVRFAFPNLNLDLNRVIGADLSSFHITTLIGRDILSLFLLIYHGPAGRFTLTF